MIVLVSWAGIKHADHGWGCKYTDVFFYDADIAILELIAIGSLVLILMTFKVMKINSRYLYRYIIFCIAEMVNTTQVIIISLGYGTYDIIFISITCIFLLLAFWRILEVLVLDDFFSSLKNRDTSASSGYTPPNQQLF